MAEQQPEVKIRIVKKKGGHAAAHGGAWKVAYADLVTAMMAFFLLMWLLNSADKNTKAGIAGMFQDANFFNTERGKEILANHGKGILPGGRGMAPGPDGDGGTDTTVEAPGSAEEEHKAMEATAEAIEKAFQQDELLQAFQDQITMDFTDEGLRIQIQDKAAQVLFDSGSAQLKPYTLSILKEIAKELGKLPNRIVVGGHTDAAQYANRAYTNWELSAERANAARRVMESAAGGLRPNQVRRVTGYADTIPFEGKDPKDPQNRRISIVVVSAASEAAESRHQKAQPREKDKR
ncbi:flagellar motor protein MotB [Geothrix oryzae]|uniref:Flagellar motor protein MotB n=1 Tax=Geothrix oryzae TaxID=2927975 RepID=A0ABM8DMX5_9BACT|nr:flagellar motor protein MotB [Geothrix oryzae]BDU68278.1 flagellar motor protein MotB [Geothrix oryzae]